MREDVLAQCLKCRRFMKDGKMIDQPEGNPSRTSTICPKCSEKLKLKKLK
jgi:hypothetical protein